VCGARAATTDLDLGEMPQDVMSIPAAAAVMTPNVALPKYLSNGEFTRLPITLSLLVSLCGFRKRSARWIESV
jgi:hypothetical protein